MAAKENIDAFVAVITVLQDTAASVACVQAYLTQLIARNQTAKRSLIKHIALDSFQKNLSRRKKKRLGRFVRFWVRPGRTSLWWDNFANGSVVAEEWKENFRMSKWSFMKLCGEIGPHIAKKKTNMRLPLSVEKQLAIFLYYIADEGRIRKTQNAYK